MTPELEHRLLLASKAFDRVERLRSLVEDSEGTSARALVASAAILSAEILATAAGKGDNTPLIHRMYEEITASIESSPAVGEAFSSIRTAEVSGQMLRADVQSLVTEFRCTLALGSEDHDSE